MDSLSLVGNGFFSCVSVFFSFVLSKVVTSEMSGLSPMARLGCCEMKSVEREKTDRSINRGQKDERDGGTAYRKENEDGQRQAHTHEFE